jgi:hypothetical protein
MIRPPETLYLQWDVLGDGADATWCEDMVDDDDIVYVHKKRFDALVDVNNDNVARIAVAEHDVTVRDRAIQRLSEEITLSIVNNSGLWEREIMMKKRIAELENELGRKTAEATAFYMEATNARQHIAELEEKNADMQEQITWLQWDRRWIPVSERLPEELKNVLICGDGIEPSMSYYDGDYKRWSKNDEYWWEEEKEVTHWMPLPFPPEVE